MKKMKYQQSWNLVNPSASLLKSFFENKLKTSNVKGLELEEEDIYRII